MKKILSTLLVIAFALIGLNANAQQKVVPNSVHRYVVKKKNPADVINNIYTWRVLKGTTDAVLGTDFEFVTSYTDATSATVPYAKDEAEFKDASKAAETPIVYIKWLIAADYTVQTMTFDATSKCYDANVNFSDFTVNVDENNNNFVATLTWDVVTGDGADDADCATSEADEKGKTATTFTLKVAGHRIPLKDDGAGNLILNVAATSDQIAECAWKYEYKFAFGETEPDWSTITDKKLVNVTFDLAKYQTDSFNTSIIPIEGEIPQGTGQWFAWVNLTMVNDGYGNSPNSTSVLKVKATFNRIPKKQTIISD